MKGIFLKFFNLMSLITCTDAIFIDSLCSRRRMSRDKEVQMALQKMH